MFRVATDIGGTFTDIAYCEFDIETGSTGPIRIFKSDTVPEDLTAGVMNAVAGAGLRPQDMVFFAHGTTVVINVLTERKGARTGLITTEGFRDVLEIARGNRPDLFNFRFRKPPPFVPRYLRHEVRERVSAGGEIVMPIDLGAIEELVEFFREQAVEAIAVSFLHAYANPANERAAVARIAELWPEVHVMASHTATREWREYERTCTAVLSAYSGPVVNRYLHRLEQRLEAEGLSRPPFIMLSNGGIASIAKAREAPIAIVESGPASGVLGAAALAAAIERQNVIALDIGGTTAKCSLIDGGQPLITTGYRIEGSPANPGYPVKTPVVDIVEIGTGGGSIAYLDAGSKLHVGPQSAGANPGPVVYGRGGTAPTVTDAHVLTGRIDVANVLGRRGGDLDAVRAAFAALGRQIGADAKATAKGVLQIADANMENALKLVSLNRGYDPREFGLVAYGGGGPLHGAALAVALHIPEVIVPIHAPVFSAFGMLLTDIRRDYLRTDLVRLDNADPSRLRDAFAILEDDAHVDFAGEETEGGRLVLEWSADMRYHGQEHTVKVSLPRGTVDDGAVRDWEKRFRLAHDRLYNITLPAGVELVNFHLIARSIVVKPEFRDLPRTGRPISEARLGARMIDFGEAGRYDAAVYDRSRLEPEMTVSGPAAIEEQGTVTILWPGQEACIDRIGNIVIRTGA